MGKRRTQRDIRRRTLSQNFLVGGRAIERFLSAADIQPTDLVLEIGAGTGVLTSRLAAAAGTVVAYEVDQAWSPRLTAALSSVDNVRIVFDDILKAVPPREHFKVVGNIPFGSTAAMIGWILSATCLQTATVLTQLEYARKRTGYGGRWSRLTILTWPSHEWRFVSHIPRTEFRPVPRVDAAVLQIHRREPYLLSPPDLTKYEALVTLGFTGVGGSVYRTLRKQFPATLVEKARRAAALAEDTLVRDVSPQQWLALYRDLYL